MNEDHPSSSGSEPQSWFARLSHALTGGEPRNREELLSTLSQACASDILDADTLGMIEGALDMSEMQVRDAMIPRGQMMVVPCDARLEELLPMIVESGHSRFPVIKDDKDEVTGILMAKDLLRFFVQDGNGFNVKKILRPAVFIPESKGLNMLLNEFRTSRNHMALVVDEFGGVSGLITIEDVLEEIVGEIDDEHDQQEVAHITRQKDEGYTIDALTPIEEFNEFFKASLSADQFDTLGGLLTGQVGRLPERGEIISIDDFTFEVLQADNRRLLTLGLNLVES
jgi:magnesium and cobalt transporter